MTAGRDYAPDGSLRLQKLTALALAAASWNSLDRAPLELPPRTPAAAAVDEVFAGRAPALWYRYSRAAIIARTLTAMSGALV